jgi:ubiquinone/menaquinone biosynthesis C-methylase UbiE
MYDFTFEGVTCRLFEHANSEGKIRTCVSIDIVIKMLQKGKEKVCNYKVVRKPLHFIQGFALV